ncbi:MAG: DUF368 domain-containing protein [Verrucomicrobiales bacterium]|nr:DUF368 domain-containing protein [Verrucomicrobiales bacterium]
MNWLSHLSHFLKGSAMGAANVIPGVSGGTVAFVTGIYERLIEAIKACNLDALKLLFRGKFRDFADKIDFGFLFSIGLGVIASILTLAQLFKFLLIDHKLYLWAFFFGLILASIIFVGKRVSRWSVGAVVGAVIGLVIAIGTTILFEPASESDAIPYLMLCGVVAMASMVIPGLSGSFVLLLLGNYELVFIKSVNQLRAGDWEALKILIPVGLGAVVGLVALSHLLSWIFRKFHDIAVAAITGFIAGSLVLIWPWKTDIVKEFVTPTGETKSKTIDYDWNLPALNGETFVAVGLIVAGFVAVWLLEKSGELDTEEPEAETGENE